MQQKTVTYYQQKVNDVLNYINNHLDENLNTKALAEKFCISFYHFHRIFKAVLNEPLGSYIKRVRLETATKLIRYSNEQLSDIALRIGYNDLSSFSKAFSKEFGISPNEYKENNNIVLNTHIDYTINTAGKLIFDLKPKIIDVPGKNVACITVIGQYGGEETLSAWDNLGRFALQNKISGWKPEVFALYYDDPDLVGLKNCKSDICITAKKKFIPCENIVNKYIEGGRFAVFRYKGPYELLWDLYYSIYRNWVLTTDVKLRDLPMIEKYIVYSPSTKPENLLTEVYIPIE